MNKKNNNLREKVIRLEEKLIAADKALEIAQKSMHDRLAGMNEFREQLKDQAGRFITRDELNLLIDKLELQIDSNTKAKNELQGKANASTMYISIALAIIAILVSLAKLLN